MNLILFIFGVIGLTHIVTDSEISEPVYEWIKPRSPLVARLMDCHQCAGYWCGFALGPMLGWNPMIWFVAGCAGSFLAQLGYWMLDSLEAFAKGKR